MRRLPPHPANALALARLRHLVRERRPDIVHAHSSVGGALGRLAAAHSPARRVYTAHGLAPGRGPLVLERALGQLTDRWVAVSDSEADALLHHRVAAPGALVVIRNGIDLTIGAGAARAVRPGLRERLALPPGAPLVGTVARLVAQKRPEHFVRVCAGVARDRPDAWFVLVGSGPLRAKVLRQVAQAGLGPRFRHVPALPDVAALLGELDVFVLTSRFEGAPYTPLEAMRAGVPVVLSDVVGNRDVVEAGCSGELFAPGDVAGMAAAITALLGDPDRREALVTAARARLIERFDVAEMAHALEQLYLGLAR